MKKFGTFGGVFTPSLLTILGVIMYLRMGWVVGNAGSLVMVMAIIFLAHVVSLSTGLSVSSIATDKKIKSGGIYYILSRSLGFPFGGAIGLTLYVATALSIALYLIGFGESILQVMQGWLHIEEITTNHLRVVGTIALLVIVTIAYISTSFAIKTQYFILTAIALSLISIFLGTSEGKGFDFSAVNFEDVPSFGVIFGVFFPAVTGFTAGVAMSGDLKTPEKSIPWGTMLAILVGLIIYSILAVFIYYHIPGAELVKNNNALVEFSWIPQLVVAGIWGATLSSALGGILGGPRILQSMSLDKITPRIFGKGVGKDNEPRNALLLTAILAEAGILIGELNVIAGVVAMFYMAAYLVINLSCFLEKWASPDFRPKFKINIFIPLLGVVTIFLLMIELNLAATLASIVIIGGIFAYLTRKQLVLSSGDVWSSVWSSVVKLGLKNLDQKPKNKRNWEPNILLFSGDTDSRRHLIDFSIAIAGRGGMISNFDLIENPTAKTLFPKREQALEQDDFKEGIVFQRKQECNNLFKGIEAIASTYGFSGIEPNTTLMGWARNTKDPVWFADMNKKLTELDYNILYLDYDKNRKFGQYKKIDIWWDDINNVSELTLQIAKRVVLSEDWSNAEIRILYINNRHQKSVIESLILKQLASLRIDFPFEVINNEIDRKSFYEIVKKYSYDADLIIVEIPEMKRGEEASFVKETNDFLVENATTLLVRASESFTANTKQLLSIEQSYKQEGSRLQLRNMPIEALQFSGCKVLDDAIKGVDDQFIAINQKVSADIFTGIIDIYQTLFTLLKEKFDANTKIHGLSLLETKRELIDDIIVNTRFDKVSAVIKASLEYQIKKTNESIEALPKNMSRTYTPEDLRVNETDSEDLRKIKKNLLKKKKEKLRLLQTARDLYRRDYLKNLSQQLNQIGVSSKMINAVFIDWINHLESTKTLDLNILDEELELAYKTLGSNHLNRLNTDSRSLGNALVRASNSLEESTAAPGNQKKTKKVKQKDALKTIQNYAQNWLTNQKLLINHLLFSVQLRGFQVKMAQGILENKRRIEEELLDKTILTIKQCDKKLNAITLEDINTFKSEFYQISNHISSEPELNSIQSQLAANLLFISENLDLMSLTDLADFDTEQDQIAATKLNARRTTNGVVENEIIASLNVLYQQIINAGRTENTKLENALELIKYSLLNTVDDKKQTEAVLQKTKLQFKEAIENIERIKIQLSIETDELLTTLKTLLNVETISEKAGAYGAPFQKMGASKFSNSLKMQIEKLENTLDEFLLKSRDKVAESEFLYRAKAIQNPHTLFADFVDGISLSKQTEKKLPFYYNQLFTGKHTAPTELLHNRKTELAAVKKAMDRFNEGKNGAILFTGEPQSGKTYLMQNALNLYFPKNVVTVTAPSDGVSKGTDSLNSAFAMATGLKGSSSEIVKQLPKKSTLVFEDLELWWTRTPSGSESLEQIIELIKRYGHIHVFVLDCNRYFYEHIRQFLPIDEQLLATITTGSLTISQITETILNRHHSGGMKFIWQDIPEDKLNSRQVNNVFRKITAQTDGNIGMALFRWLGNIADIDKNEMHLSDFINNGLPAVLSPDWENMLWQFLLHKHITLRRLKQVYSADTGDEVENNIQSLLRTGLVIRTSVNSYCLSPYALPFIMKYLHQKQEYVTT
jgi:amino acid transporter